MTTPGKNTETPEFDRLADEIIRRERVLLFAPGIASFLVAHLVTMFGLILLFSAAVSLMLADAGEETQAFAALGSVQVAIALVIVPSVMLMKGLSAAGQVWRRIVDVGLAAGVIAAGVAYSRGLRSEAIEFLVALALLGVAFLVVRTVGFAMITVFRQRIRARRAFWLEQHRAVSAKIMK